MRPRSPHRSARSSLRRRQPSEARLPEPRSPPLHGNPSGAPSGHMYYPQESRQPAPGNHDLGTSISSMSFRRRLLLFFVIIVVVPMVAVALVLFSITADSENGKADASIAQGLRSAAAIYDTGRRDARRDLAAVARDPQLAAALEKGRRGQVRARLGRLARAHGDVVAIRAYDSDERQLAAAGSKNAIAFAAATPS